MIEKKRFTLHDRLTGYAYFDDKAGFLGLSFVDTIIFSVEDLKIIAEELNEVTKNIGAK